MGWCNKRKSKRMLGLAIIAKRITCVLNCNCNTVFSILSLTTQRTIHSMNANTSSLCYIFYCGGNHRDRVYQWYKRLRPDVIADTQRNALSKRYIFQGHPLIWPYAEFMFLGSLHYQATPSSQANSGSIVSNMPVSDNILCSVTATYLNSPI